MQNQPNFGKAGWPVSYGGRRRLDDLLGLLPDANRRDLGDCAIWAHLHPEPLVRHLTAHFISRLELHLNDLDAASAPDFTLFPKLESCVSAAEKLAKMVPAMRDLPCEEESVRDQLGAFLEGLDLALGHCCRVRVYRIDASAGCYKGLASRGMKQRYYANHFDVGANMPFESTERLPRSAAKYERIEGTACQLLTKDAIDTLEPEDRDWYLRVIGFGKTVAESYTWEFTADGVEELSYSDTRAKPERYVAAVSLDAGQQRSGAENRTPIETRKLHPLSIDWLDVVLRSPIGDAFAGGVSGLVGALAARSASLTSVAASTALMNEESGLFPPRFKAIPAGTPSDQSWVFADGDTICNHIYELYDRFRKSDLWLGILGPSGVGKEVIARALHNNGHRRGQSFVKVNVPAWDSELLAVVGGGIAAGTFTGQGGEAESVFEAAHGGTCFWDEVFLADAVTLGKLLSPLSDLKERNEATRTALGNVRSRVYDANIRSIAAGDPAKRQRHFDGHAEGRLLPAKIALPSWGDLSVDSRVILVRWMMLGALRKHKLRGGQMSLALFRYLVYCQPGTLLETNMRGLGNIWGTLGELQTNGVFNLSCLRGQWTAADQECAEPLIRDGLDDQYPASLRIGEGTPFETRLNAFEHVVLQIAKCDARGEKHAACVSKEECDAAAAELLRRQGEPFWHEQLCEAFYLLFAASSLHLTDQQDGPQRATAATCRTDKKDLLATAPRPLQRHFQDWTIFEEIFKSVSNQPFGALTKRSANGHRMALRYQEFIEQPDVVARLLQSVERIACAYPSYLHHVPYWAHWAERHGGHSGNVSGQAVFQEKDGETLQISEEEEYDNE
jgi:hypothetical protein